MMTRQFSLLLPGLALLTAVALPSGAAQAQPAASATTSVVTTQDDSLSWQYASDKKKPKPTPGPQDGDD